MLCSPSEVTQDIRNKAIVVKRGNCTFLEKAEIAQRFGAKLLLVASETSIVRSSFCTVDCFLSVFWSLETDLSIFFQLLLADPCDLDQRSPIILVG